MPATRKSTAILARRIDRYVMKGVSNHARPMVQGYPWSRPQETQLFTSNLVRFSSSKSSSASTSKKRRNGGRHYAYRKNEKARQEQEKKEKKKAAKQSHIHAPRATSQGLPPVLLAPTGSPHVFISKMALGKDPDAISMSQSLFSNYMELPGTFETHQFEYLSPQALKFEYPTSGNAEVAFLGRSNVGKSSLVNALMRRNLCQTSKSPGRTQLPYYYGLFQKRLLNNHDSLQPTQASGYLVDLPGYGFGTAPKEVVESWQTKTQEWLIDRREAGVLRRLFILLDARRDEGPSHLDSTVIEWAEEAEIPFSLVLTKADRATVPKTVKLANDICIRHATRQGTFQSPIFHVTSSSKHWGVHELLESIEAEFFASDDDEDDDDIDLT